MNEAHKRREYPGNPRMYLRIVVATTVFWAIWMYGGMALVQYLWTGETWMFHWKPALVAVLFFAWYARYAYRWMMRGDAQWGKGSGWVLKERTVKLPETKF